MKLVNKTKENTISDNLNKASSFKEKAVGLLGSNDPKAIYFQTRWGIHTIGMNFSIDCIILDKNMTVRKIKENLKPGKLFVWNPKYNNVVELPSGTVEQKNIEILDKLSIHEK